MECVRLAAAFSRRLADTWSARGLPPLFPVGWPTLIRLTCFFALRPPLPRGCESHARASVGAGLKVVHCKRQRRPADSEKRWPATALHIPLLDGAWLHEDELPDVAIKILKAMAVHKPVVLR